MRPLAGPTLRAGAWNRAMRCYSLLVWIDHTASAAPSLPRFQVPAQARFSAAQAPRAAPRFCRLRESAFTCTSVGRYLPDIGAAPRIRRQAPNLIYRHQQFGRDQMPVILWLLGVPLVVVVLLMLFHVI